MVESFSTHYASHHYRVPSFIDGKSLSIKWFRTNKNCHSHIASERSLRHIQPILRKLIEFEEGIQKKNLHTAQTGMSRLRQSWYDSNRQAPSKPCHQNEPNPDRPAACQIQVLMYGNPLGLMGAGTHGHNLLAASTAAPDQVQCLVASLHIHGLDQFAGTDPYVGSFLWSDTGFDVSYYTNK